MAKNAPWKGKSAKRGNAASPYAKYHKAPYVYSQAHRDWQRANKARGATSTKGR